MTSEEAVDALAYDATERTLQKAALSWREKGLTYKLCRDLLTDGILSGVDVDNREMKELIGSLARLEAIAAISAREFELSLENLQKEKKNV